MRRNSKTFFFLFLFSVHPWILHGRNGVLRNTRPAAEVLEHVNSVLDGYRTGLEELQLLY